LCRTARFAACNTLKAEHRRQHREQEAHMNSLLNEPEPDVWPQVAPLLDEAVAQLGEADRNAVVLRFYEQRPLEDVGRVLGLNADAAQKRASRALEKLRKFFMQRGVVSTTVIIAGAISANSVQAAPAALANTVAGVAIAKGAAAGSSILTLVKATLIAMKIKSIVATIVAAVVVLGVGTYLAYQSKATPPASVPIKLANDDFGDHGDNDKFLREIDPNTRRATNSAPAIHIKCLVAPTSTGSADYLNSLPAAFERGLAATRAARYDVTKDSPLFGKRIRITGWMKTSDVRNWAGVGMDVLNKSGHILADDQMYDRPIHGTTDWQQIEFVTDVPREPCIIVLSPTLYGTGEIWCDDFQIDVVPSDTPITDDRRWTVWSQCPNDYSETTDYNVAHNGHPALRIEYISSAAPHKYSFVWWGQHLRDREKFRRYLGHTVRMSVWAKSENLSVNAGLNFEPKDGNGQRLAKHSAFGGYQIKGTTDWAEHSITCDIPKDTQDFQTAFFIFGSGKLWIDMDSVKFEIVE
jgi:Sigma-70, region 4